MKQIAKKVMMMSFLMMAACSPANEAAAQTAENCRSMNGGVCTTLMPKLGLIQTKVLTKPYSCGGSYEKSALFLDQDGKSRNSPVLLMDCYSFSSGARSLTLSASTAGNDIGLIADLGDVPLEKISGMRALNYEWQVGKDNTFKQNQVAKEGHTYSVIIARNDQRIMYAFKIFSLDEKLGQMGIRYTVKMFEVSSPVRESSGWAWEAENQEYKGRH